MVPGTCDDPGTGTGNGNGYGNGTGGTTGDPVTGSGVDEIGGTTVVTSSAMAIIKSEKINANLNIVVTCELNQNTV